MSDKSAIQWTDATWNPVVGCMKVSAGCERCYAITQAYRLEHNFKQAAYAGTTRKLPDGSMNWTGKVRCLPERLSAPLRWREPRRVFVNSMSDLFHPDVPDEFIEQVFGAMAAAHWHTFQVLTKRPERMLAWFTERYQVPLIDGRIGWEGRDNRVWAHRGDTLDPTKDTGWTADGQVAAPWSWPLPNVWLGVSTEDQLTANERIPLLLKTPAAVRFLSCEPLIGPIDLSDFLPYYTACGASRDEQTTAALNDLFRAVVRKMGGPGISWVIAGGESGADHRPLNLDWARSLRDQCAAHGIAYYFKQVGGRTHAAGGRLLDGRTHDEFPEPDRAASTAGSRCSS